MKNLHLSEHITDFRHKRGITQEQLATYLGVTKASVSKWETGQSFPDILLLVQIATYFGVSVDTLLGYEPQMTQDEILRKYKQFAKEFAKEPFDEVMAKINKLVKKYYSCYPLLQRICILWINHYMLADSKEKQEDVLKQVINLCNHILENCEERNIINDAKSIQSMAYLLINKPDEVLRVLGENISPKIANEMLIARAYQMLNNFDKSKQIMQISMYQDLLNLVSTSVEYLAVCLSDVDLSENIIKRTKCLIEKFNLHELNPNTAMIFYYEAAVFYCTCNNQEQAISYLSRFVAGMEILCNRQYLHGDQYFNQIDEWLNELSLGVQMPRDVKSILETAKANLNCSIFVKLNDNTQYIELQNKLNALEEKYK